MGALSQAATLARGRKVRQAKLLFYAKLAEKGLQTYERDGWGEFPTQIVPERREIRPTADRGPILLCVDTSGGAGPATQKGWVEAGTSRRKVAGGQARWRCLWRLGAAGCRRWCLVGYRQLAR